MMKKATNCLTLIITLSSTAILCPAILSSPAKAQEQSVCYMVDQSEHVRDLSSVCSPNNQGQNSGNMATAEEIFQLARDLDSKGKHQEAIAEYTRAIQSDPNHAEAYIFRGNALVLEGQPHKGIADLQQAAAIYLAKGDSHRAAIVQQYEQRIWQGIRDGEI